MTYQGNRNIAYLISELISVVLYVYLALAKYQAETFNPQTISSDWGKLVLTVIGVQIGTSIVFSILITIIQAIRTREEKPELADERDRLIELKANNISFSAFGIGFLIAMITLAMGKPPLVMFHVVVLSIFGAFILGNIVQLYMYRRGF